MSEAASRLPAGRRLAETVFVADPTTHGTVVLKAGTMVSDSALADQITHPSAWSDDEVDQAVVPELAEAEKSRAAEPTDAETPRPRTTRRSRSGR
ncbi:hypothetical protein OG393_18755 [Streptomyces sp. NBC_01216]|uniref:hypothetical protein n=1 Tax=Streptomyces sp. NBC_01216 TaxID=2903778 RepID=UPI002E0D254C|nr:hypothetical protein OG393_18755 [Streptomyces sp. NBC_01216]